MCTSKDSKVVEYAMSRSLSPTMVSEYTLNLIDKKMLENKLKEITEIVKEGNITEESILEEWKWVYYKKIYQLWKNII